MTIANTISIRQRLPNRRGATTFAFDLGTQRYTATVGHFPDGALAGRVGEIFITAGRAGSDLDAAARDSAVVCSLALQHGVELETIRHALLRDPRGNPSGPLGAALGKIAGGAADD